MTYYEIGTIINKRKIWGSKYIKNLANDLKEYGKGYSYENLYRMSKVSEEFSNEEIMSHPVTQIPWSTLVTVIMAKSSTHEEMLWYINETYKNGWSRSMVLNQIAMKAYERSLIEPTTSNITKSDDLSNELFKDTYVFDFLDKNNIKNEKDLKKHKYDVFRLLQIVTTGIKVESEGLVTECIHRYIEEISAVDESEIRLLQMGMPFDRDRGVELLKEIYL